MGKDTRTDNQIKVDEANQKGGGGITDGRQGHGHTPSEGSK